MLEPAHVNVCGTKASVGLVLPPGTPALEAAMMCRLLHRLFPATTFDTNPNPVEASFLPFDVYGNPGACQGVVPGAQGWPTRAMHTVGTWHNIEQLPLPTVVLPCCL